MRRVPDLDLSKFDPSQKQEIEKIRLFLEQVSHAIGKIAEGKKPDGSGDPLP